MIRRLSFLGVAVLTLGGLTSVALTGKEHVRVDATLASEIPPLSAELVPLSGSPGVLMVLGRIDAVGLSETQDQGLTVQVGEVTIEVLEVLAGDARRPGDKIKIPAKRVADPIVRVRHGFDHWNVLSLKNGDVLLVAIQSQPPQGRYYAVAARQVESPSSPEVVELKQAYAIERLAGPPGAKTEQLAAALIGNGDLLSHYALDVLQRRLALGREAGARLITAALSSPSARPERRLQMAESLTELFDSARHADETNVAIVRAIAQALVAERDLQRRSTWTAYLAAVVLKEFTGNAPVDRQIRSALIRKVQTPNPREMIAILTAHAEQDSDDVQARGLLRAWRTATPPE
jgi:hypothetical protein